MDRHGKSSLKRRLLSFWAKQQWMSFWTSFRFCHLAPPLLSKPSNRTGDRNSLHDEHSGGTAKLAEYFGRLNDFAAKGLCFDLCVFRRRMLFPAISELVAYSHREKAMDEVVLGALPRESGWYLELMLWKILLGNHVIFCLRAGIVVPHHLVNVFSLCMEIDHFDEFLDKKCSLVYQHTVTNLRMMYIWSVFKKRFMREVFKY